MFKIKTNKKNNWRLSITALVFMVSFILFSIINTPQSAEINKGDFKTFLKMSEVLGAVYYLDSLCEIDNAIMWRKEMDNVLNIYKFPNTAKAEMIKSFNESFKSYKTTYKSCSLRAEEVAKIFYEEGASLAQRIALSK